MKRFFFLKRITKPKVQIFFDPIGNESCREDISKILARAKITESTQLSGSQQRKEKGVFLATLLPEIVVSPNSAPKLGALRGTLGVSPQNIYQFEVTIR